MKLFIFIAFFSLFGTKPSESGITYRALAWSDFRGAIPDAEPSVAARTTTQLAMEVSEQEGKCYYAVKAYFLPDSSFVRVRSDQNLSHEQTHFKIAYIASIRCMRELIPLQGKDSRDKAMAIYEHYLNVSDVFNDRFDRETNHCLNREAEKIWELRISHELHTLETLKPIHGGNR